VWASQVGRGKLPMVVAAMGGSCMGSPWWRFVFRYTCTVGERQAARDGLMECRVWTPDSVPVAKNLSERLGGPSSLRLERLPISDFYKDFKCVSIFLYAKPLAHTLVSV
jgi:hypothetical protein